MIEWALVLPTFIGIFMKAMQQQNVIHRVWLAIPFTTYGIAACDVFVIGGVVHYGIAWSTVNGMALGGTTGCILAMLVHKKYFIKPTKPGSGSPTRQQSPKVANTGYEGEL